MKNKGKALPLQSIAYHSGVVEYSPRRRANQRVRPRCLVVGALTWQKVSPSFGSCCGLCRVKFHQEIESELPSSLGRYLKHLCGM